jgi:hypothetical protein
VIFCSISALGVVVLTAPKTDEKKNDFFSLLSLLLVFVGLFPDKCSGALHARQDRRKIQRFVRDSVQPVVSASRAQQGQVECQGHRQRAQLDGVQNAPAQSGAPQPRRRRQRRRHDDDDDGGGNDGAAAGDDGANDDGADVDDADVEPDSSDDINRFTVLLCAGNFELAEAIDAEAAAVVDRAEAAATKAPAEKNAECNEALAAVTAAAAAAKAAAAAAKAAAAAANSDRATVAALAAEAALGDARAALLRVYSIVRCDESNAVQVANCLSAFLPDNKQRIAFAQSIPGGVTQFVIAQFCERRSHWRTWLLRGALISKNAIFEAIGLPRAVRNMLRDALAGVTRALPAHRDMVSLLSGDATHIDASGKVVVPAAYANFTSWKAMAKADPSLLARLAAVRPLLERVFAFPHAADDNEKALLRRLLSEDNAGLIDNSNYNCLSQAALVATVNDLQRVLACKDFCDAVGDESVQRAKPDRPIVSRIVSISNNANASMQVSNTAMKDLCKGMPALQLAALVTGKDIADFGAHALSTIRVAGNRVCISYDAKARDDDLERIEARDAHMAKQAEAHERRKLQHANANWTDFMSVQLGTSPFVDTRPSESKKELLDNPKLVSMTTLRMLMRSGVNTSGKPLKLDLTRGKANGAPRDALTAMLREKIDSTTKVAALLREGIGVNCDVAFADLGTGGDVWCIVRALQCRDLNSTVVELNLTKWVKRAVRDPDTFHRDAPQDRVHEIHLNYSVPVRFAHTIKKAAPMVLFVGADYLHGFTPLLRQLLRMGAWVVLIDEFRSSQFCATHLRELGAAALTSVVPVCATCIGCRDDADSKVRSRFTVAEINDSLKHRADEASAHAETASDRAAMALLSLKENNVASEATDAAAAVAAAVVVVVGPRTEREWLIDGICAEMERKGESVDGANTLVTRGPTGSEMLSTLATTAMPPARTQHGMRVIDLVPAVVKERTRRVSLDSLTLRQLRHRHRRVVARSRSRCDKCPKLVEGAKFAPRCDECAGHKRVNKYKACSLCNTTFADAGDIYLVKHTTTAWRYKHCNMCQLDLHRDRNACGVFALLVGAALLGIGAKGAKLEGKRLYPFYECAVHAADTLDGKERSWWQDKKQPKAESTSTAATAATAAVSAASTSTVAGKRKRAAAVSAASTSTAEQTAASTSTAEQTAASTSTAEQTAASTSTTEQTAASTSTAEQTAASTSTAEQTAASTSKSMAAKRKSAPTAVVAIEEAVMTAVSDGNELSDVATTAASDVAMFAASDGNELSDVATTAASDVATMAASDVAMTAASDVAMMAASDGNELSDVATTAASDAAAAVVVALDGSAQRVPLRSKRSGAARAQAQANRAKRTRSSVSRDADGSSGGAGEQPDGRECEWDILGEDGWSAATDTPTTAADATN